MYIPVNDRYQIRVFLYKDRRTEEIGIDIRKWFLKPNLIVPSKSGIRIPLSYLEQVTIRLNHLVDKYNRNK